jgi:lipopolysaccharide transport system ATP-binding protein
MHQGDALVHVHIKKDEKAQVGDTSGISTGEIELISFKICDEKGEEISYIESEKSIKIIFQVKALKNIEEPHYGLMIRNNLGLSVFETNTYCMKWPTTTLLKDQIANVEFQMNFPLVAGTYSFSIGVANKGFDLASFTEYLLLIHDIDTIQVLSNTQSIFYSGIFNMKPELTIKINN